ncbi:alpha-ketoglutarate dehydrogenase component 4-like [Rhopilema esculentum]|uniref:alpha-ketoglutarate dehydrogenase component 4-like n=1 Tax=Rhopilema esculentum TaxID=499914 RepID=UPI0031D7B818
MAAVNICRRCLQTAAARSHVPLIRFPQRDPLLGRFPLLEKIKSMVIPKSTVPKLQTKEHGIILETVSELPAKYRRQEISQEEIAYIERGGPE